MKVIKLMFLSLNVWFKGGREKFRWSSRCSSLHLPGYFSGVLIFVSKSLAQVCSDGLISSPFPPSVGSFDSICCLQIFCPNLSPAGAHLKGDMLFFYWMVLNRLHFFITAVLLSAFYTMNNNGWSSSPGLKPINLGTKQGEKGMKFLLSILVVIFIVLGVEAVEDGSSEREDGGSPGQAVAPVKLMVHPQVDRLDELDGEQNQAAHLEHHCRSDQERRWWKTKQNQIWCLLISICAGA